MDTVIAEIRSISSFLGETSAALTRTSGEIATKLAEIAAAEQTHAPPAPPAVLPAKIAMLRSSRATSWKDHLGTVGFPQEDVEELLMKKEWEDALVPKAVTAPPAVRKTSGRNVPSEEELSARIAEVAAKLRDEYAKKTKEAYEKGKSEAKQEYKKELAAYHQQVVQQLKK